MFSIYDIYEIVNPRDIPMFPQLAKERFEKMATGEASLMH